MRRFCGLAVLSAALVASSCVMTITVVQTPRRPITDCYWTAHTQVCITTYRNEKKIVKPLDRPRRVR